jgi:uroporphyrinogen decarboxylase
MPTPSLTPKQRMLRAYRGLPVDRPPVAPELWYYYPAKLLGVDMIRFQREIPFYRALKHAFSYFGCEGWGVAAAAVPNPQVEVESSEHWLDADNLDIHTTLRTPHGQLACASRLSRDEPGWSTERPLKDIGRDLAAWECLAFGAAPEQMDVSGLIKAWEDVGETYLLEGWLGVPFFDFWANARGGGFEEGILDLYDPELQPRLEALQARYTEHLVRQARVLCERTPLESFFIGCSWSCNSLLGPTLWRQWDKPVIRAVAEEVHRHGRLLHVHFHGRCIDTVADLADIAIDCVCPFERPPGGDVVGLEGLRQVAAALAGRTTMNGNVHTVETLIRGGPADARREVGEILQAFGRGQRVIVGTGDQVGRETPEENLWAMIEAARSWTAPA